MKNKREASVSEYITDAFLYLLKTNEFREISVTEICSKAGVTRMSFYRNFEDKEDILRKWITEVTDRFLKESGISYQNDSIQDYFVKLFTHMQTYQSECEALYRAGLIHIVKEQFDRVFLEIHRDDYDEYKSFFLSGGIYNVFLLWLKGGCRENPQQMAERLGNILDR